MPTGTARQWLTNATESECEMETLETVIEIVITCVVVYIMARLIFMAYFAARSAYVKEILRIAMEMKNYG